MTTQDPNAEPNDPETLKEMAACATQTVVIKIGGNSLDEDPQFIDRLAQQGAFLHKHGLRLVLVHGGGPQIDRALRAAKIEGRKRADGRRPTSSAALKIIEQVMTEMSAQLAQAFEKRAVPVFVAAKEKKFFVTARPFKDEPADSGNRAGVPATVDQASLNERLEQSRLVILHSLALGPGNQTFNTNADDYALAIASALKARRLVLATNVNGVYDDNKQTIKCLTRAAATPLFERGVIAAGMIPKVESALQAVQEGVGGVVIVNAHEPWNLVKALLNRPVHGTLICDTNQTQYRTLNSLG